ncbi:MAG: ribokinase, partial [Eubacteriales bacterium]
MKVLNYGSLNVDYVYQVDHFVQPGETISSKKLSVFCGGKGLNQSTALSRAGANVFHGGAVGNDSGNILTDHLKENKVNIDFVLTKEIQSGHAIIQVQDGGENNILLFGGANQEITCEDILHTLEHFDVGDFIILQNEISNLPYVMEEAHKKGMIIVLNPSPMDEKISMLPLEYVNYFILNEVEAYALCHETDVDKQMMALKNQFDNANIVLTLGSQGVVYSGSEGEYRQGIYKANVVDTTAAGDTFTGYFIAMIAEGKGVE